MSDQTENTENAEGSKGMLKTSKFKSEGDWINELTAKHCTTVEGAADAIPEEKDDDGNVTQKAVAAKKGKTLTNLDALHAFADANNISYKEYANIGAARMNIGNMLRAAAKKRMGLFVPANDDGDFGTTEWANAPDEFLAQYGVTEATHNPDGSKIVKAKPEAEAETA